jgi:hypothetical protein
VPLRTTLPATDSQPGSSLTAARHIRHVANENGSSRTRAQARTAKRSLAGIAHTVTIVEQHSRAGIGAKGAALLRCRSA